MALQPATHLLVPFHLVPIPQARVQLAVEEDNMNRQPAAGQRGLGNECLVNRHHLVARAVREEHTTTKLTPTPAERIEGRGQEGGSEERGREGED